MKLAVYEKNVSHHGLSGFQCKERNRHFLIYIIHKKPKFFSCKLRGRNQKTVIVEKSDVYEERYININSTLGIFRLSEFSYKEPNKSNRAAHQKQKSYKLRHQSKKCSQDVWTNLSWNRDKMSKPTAVFLALWSNQNCNVTKKSKTFQLKMPVPLNKLE